MNKKIFEARNKLVKQKKFYEILIIIIIISLVAGIIYVFFLSNNDKNMVLNNINKYFSMIKTSVEIDYTKSLLNSILINCLYCILIWLLGISIIGFPIILGILIFKSFTLGFSTASIIMRYKFKGLLGAFLYVFPHQIVTLIIYLLLSFYSLSFCYKLFSSLFLKKNVLFKYGMKKYIKVLIISLICTIITSFYEVFLSTYFIKLFTLTLK